MIGNFPIKKLGTEGEFSDNLLQLRCYEVSALDEEIELDLNLRKLLLNRVKA